MTRGRSGAGSRWGRPRHDARDVPGCERWGGPDTVLRLRDWVERITTHSDGVGEICLPVDVEDIDAFIGTYAESAPGDIRWVCGITRDVNSADIWMIARINGSSGVGAAFPVARTRDVSVSPSRAREIMTWYLRNRIEHEFAPVEEERFPDVLAYDPDTGRLTADSGA